MSELFRHPKRPDYSPEDTGMPAGVRLQVQLLSGLNGETSVRVQALFPDDPALDEGLTAIVEELQRVIVSLRRHGPSVFGEKATLTTHASVPDRHEKT